MLTMASVRFIIIMPFPSVEVFAYIYKGYVYILIIVHILLTQQLGRWKLYGSLCVLMISAYIGMGIYIDGCIGIHDIYLYLFVIKDHGFIYMFYL